MDYAGAAPPHDIGPYRRRDHFRECLRQMIDIPTDIVPQHVISEIKPDVENMQDRDNITELRKILKTHRLNRYYEYMHSIKAMTLGKNAPLMNPRLLEIITDKFDQVSDIYKTIPEFDRMSFLPYHFLIWRLLELAAVDHRDEPSIVENFRELSEYHRPKTRERDTIKERYHFKRWKVIVDRLGWPYLSPI